MSRPQNPIVRLLEFAGPHKRLTIAGCALSALNAVLAIAMLVCVWFVVRDLVAVAPAWGEARQAPVYGAWALAFALAGLVVYFAALMCTHLAAFRTATNMRKAALEHLAKVPLGYFSVRSTGELRRVIEGSTGLTEGVLAHRIPDFVGALVTPVAYLVVMFVFDWVMGLVCLIPVLASAFCMFLMMGGGLGGKDGEGNSNAMQFMVNYQNALDKMNKAAVEYVRGIPVVKVFQQTVHSFRAFRESIVAYCDFATAYVKLCEGPQVAQLVAINATFFVLVPAGILLAGAAGDFGAFLTNFLFYVIFSALTTMMMSKIMYSSQAVTEAQDAVSRIDGILSAPLMAEVDPARAEAPADDAIDFDHVTFSYPGADAPALEDVVLHVPSGATVALVGPSGGGKTTTCSLLPRFYDVAAGAVTIDGVDVRDVQLASLREAIGIVQQDVYLFGGTVGENIAYGRPGATQAEIEEAARKANIHEFICSLPDGYDTLVGERGARLSGGQKQRISIARVFLRDPRILILDEATSALDNESEHAIQASLAELSRGRTTITIAHRLSTIRNASLIAVVEDGRVLEQGTHDELLARDGVYARYYRMQFGG